MIGELVVSVSGMVGSASGSICILGLGHAAAKRLHALPRVMPGARDDAISIRGAHREPRRAAPGSQ